MIPHADVVRRARPLLGTLVEIGARGPGAARAIDSAFLSIASVQAALSRFDPRSEIARFNRLGAGAELVLGKHARRVLRASRHLAGISAGAFDVSQGSGPRGWHLRADRLRKTDSRTRIDLGGIGKGYAVDHAIATMRAAGCRAGWVNAGGDLRVFGALRMPLALRDEAAGSLCTLGMLERGALATSRFGNAQRSALYPRCHRDAHLSIIARRCLWADALTKLLADPDPVRFDPDALLARFGARALRHA